MPWWAALYALFYVWLMIDGARDDWRAAHSPWYIGASLLAGLSILTLATAYWYVTLASALGRWAVPMLVFALCWEGVSAVTDLRHSTRPATMSPRIFRWTRVLAVVGIVTVSLPAYTAAVVVVHRALAASAV